MSKPDLISTFVAAIADVRRGNNAHVAATTFLAYDTCTTLAHEVEHIWNAPWSGPKILYIIGRYYALVHLVLTLIVDTRHGLGVKFCKHYLIFWDVGPGVLATVLNITCTIRIHALFRSTRVLTVLAVLQLFQFGAVITTTVLGSRLMQGKVLDYSSVGLGSSMTGCQIEPSFFELLSWVPMLILALIFVIMTIVKFRDFVRTVTGGLQPIKWRYLWSHWSLVMHFLRDGTMFSVLVILVLLVCMSIALIVAQPCSGAAFSWITTVYSFSATRLVLNVRIEAQTDSENENESSALTNIEFAPSIDQSDSKHVSTSSTMRPPLRFR